MTFQCQNLILILLRVFFLRYLKTPAIFNFNYSKVWNNNNPVFIKRYVNSHWLPTVFASFRVFDRGGTGCRQSSRAAGVSSVLRAIRSAHNEPHMCHVFVISSPSDSYDAPLIPIIAPSFFGASLLLLSSFFLVCKKVASAPTFLTGLPLSPKTPATSLPLFSLSSNQLHTTTKHFHLRFRSPRFSAV